MSSWDKRLISILTSIVVLIIPLLSLFPQEYVEQGRFSIYFREKEVGYESYTWKEDSKGYYLEISGRITEPVRLEITKLVIRLDKSFIPSGFYLKGRISGVSQEVSTVIQDGMVENEIKIADQKRKSKTQVRRNAFLLPTAVYSPFMVITKKFGCGLEEQKELAAYIIPQLEVHFTLEPLEGEPCALLMMMNGIEIELETDEKGNLNSITIPSQQLRIIRTSLPVP
ncbi:MAG: hypothetical protein ACE5LC_04915 [Candidatus Aminicenantales bacterium]